MGTSITDKALGKLLNADVFDKLKGVFGKPQAWEKEIGRLSHARLIDVLILLSHTSNPGTVTKHRPGELVANRAMSGFPHPCSSPECRVRETDHLARFASLYSEHLAVRDVFSIYPRLLRNPKSWMHDSSLVNDLKSIVYGDLQTLMRLKPLFDAGIAGFASTPDCFCAACLQELTGRSSDFITQEAARLRAATLKRLLASSKFTFRKYDTFNSFTVSNEGLGGCNESSIVGNNDFLPPLPRAKKRAFRYRLSKAEARKSPILSHLAHELVDDLLAQDLYAWTNVDSSYVTNRSLDLEIAGELSPASVADQSRAFIQGLKHAVPIIENVPIERIVNMREREPEAFAVYRSSVQKVVEETRRESATTIRQAVKDLVQPEVEKIDQKFRNSKKALGQELIRNVIYGTGFVTAGLWSGILTKEAGSVVAGLGGLKYFADVLRGASSLRVDPPDVRSERMFFLWKLRALKE